MLAGHKAALQYARQHFARLKDSNMPEIQRLMGSLCYTRRQSSSPYAEFNSPAQWDDVAHEFTRQCCGLLGQVHSYLSASFHFTPYNLRCGASCDSSEIPGLKAQVYVVCDKAKLVGVLFKKRAQCPVVAVVAVRTAPQKDW